MPIDISNLSYVPTLANRRNEIRGLEKLPSLTKDRLQPLFLLAPWPNAGELTRAITRIEEAYPNRPYFLDLDRDYIITNNEAPAQIDWVGLFEAEDSYGNWREFVASHEFINPCIQFIGLTSAEIILQINYFQALGRNYVLRLELSRLPDNLEDIISAFNSVGTADFVVIIDAGWQNDTVQLRLQISQLITQQLAGIGATIPIVVSYTSIPKLYSDIDGVDVVEFDNRALIADIQTITNRTTLIYGDWGSTRPRDNKSGRTGPPRIDYPIKNGWIIARNPDDWDFNHAASAIMENEQWHGNLGVWGEAMIEQTLTSPKVGISYAGMNIATRVNIHLHVQAFYDVDDLGGMNLDEDWQD